MTAGADIRAALDYIIDSAIALAMLPPGQRDSELAEAITQGGPDGVLFLAAHRAPLPVLGVLLRDHGEALIEAVDQVEKSGTLDRRAHRAAAVDMSLPEDWSEDPRRFREVAVAWAINHPDIDWSDSGKVSALIPLLYGIDDDTDIVAAVTDPDEG